MYKRLHFVETQLREYKWTVALIHKGFSSKDWNSSLFNLCRHRPYGNIEWNCEYRIDLYDRLWMTIMIVWSSMEKQWKTCFALKLISERNLILQLMALRFGDDVSTDQRLVPKRQDAAEWPWSGTVRYHRGLLSARASGITGARLPPRTCSSSLHKSRMIWHKPFTPNLCGPGQCTIRHPPSSSNTLLVALGILWYLRITPLGKVEHKGTPWETTPASKSGCLPRSRNMCNRPRDCNEKKSHRNRSQLRTQIRQPTWPPPTSRAQTSKAPPFDEEETLLPDRSGAAIYVSKCVAFRASN